MRCYNILIMPPARTTLRWSAYEHEHIERGSDWFWALAIVAVCGAIIAIVFHDVLFAVLILLAATTLALLARTPPELMHFELSDRGIRVGDTMHKFEEILAFWVEDHDVERPLLLVDTTKFMSPNLIIPIEEIDPHAVREYLRTRAEEVPMKEPVAHKVLEFFGL
jgi:hypothetical protein